MQKVIKHSGYLSLITSFLCYLVIWYFDANRFTYQTREIAGFISILLACSFVFFGIKKYRDVVNEGNLGFMEGLKIGFYITIFPALSFGLFTWLYIKYLNPDFVEITYDHMVQTANSLYTGSELSSHLNNLASKKEMLANPLIQGGIMLLTVLAIGTIVSVISSFYLKNFSKKNSSV